MTDDLFNTPSDEVSRLVKELTETKEALRELSGKLARIETRLSRVFPQAFAKAATDRKKEKQSKTGEPTTLTANTAMVLYEQLVEDARNNRFEEVRQRLSSLSVPDLSFLRSELGASLGKRKPSPKVLIEVIVGRIRESVMLSKHTNRQQLLDESSSTEEKKKD
jgi:hypothetical protein